MERKYPVIDITATSHNIRNIMQAKNITVKDIQQFLGLETPQSVYHWLSGRNMPTIDNLYALSELFQLPIDAIIIGNRKYNSNYHICDSDSRDNCRYDSDIRMRYFLMLYYRYVMKRGADVMTY